MSDLATIERPTSSVSVHDDVDRLVTRAVLGTLLSVQRRTFNMTKLQFDAWVEQQINFISKKLA